MRGQCSDQGAAKHVFGARLGMAAALLVMAADLSACSTLQGIMTGRDTVAAADAAPGANDPYPSLGDVPDRPEPAESVDERREVAKSLIADRDRVAYMDQQLRGGTEVSAPPPPSPVAGAAPLAETTVAATPAAAPKVEEADEPGFFGRLFGRKKTVAPEETARLPAQPTGSVDVAPVGAAAPGPQGPSAP